MKLNTNAYIENILIPESPAMKIHFGKETFTFQQDNAPSHIPEKLKRGRTNYLNFWSKETWPPASPDLNPLDFNIWSILKTEACAKTHNTVEGLKVCLKKARSKIPQKLCISVESFRGRLKKVVNAKGGHTEI